MAYHRSVLPQVIDDYVRSVGARETPVQRELREATAKLPHAGMQIGADEACLLATKGAPEAKGPETNPAVKSPESGRSSPE